MKLIVSVDPVLYIIVIQWSSEQQILSSNSFLSTETVLWRSYFLFQNFISFDLWTRFIHFVFNLTYFFVDCMYMGVAYKSGSSFPKGDGCNRCTCMDTGDISCDQHSCLPCKLRYIFFICRWEKTNVIRLLYQLFFLQTTILKLRRMLE